MKIIQLLLLSSIVTCGFGQNKIVGLYGVCEEDIGNYMCQQVLFKSDGTFIFYDLLHLSGWTLSEGTWKTNGDTIILTSLDSLNQPRLRYKGSSTEDSINIYVFSDDNPLAFATVLVDTLNFQTNLKGRVKIPKDSKEIFTTYVGHSSAKFKLDPLKTETSDTLEIELIGGLNNRHFFNNEKWLLDGKKLYHTAINDKKFDSLGYFEKVPMKKFKYSEDY